ncbi:hypothetical protein F5146DRAFT_996593 [Armillaria mellea]|nr:hypothetical protein F5146DRAFT_996593 [Armillaria mellea]
MLSSAPTRPKVFRLALSHFLLRLYRFSKMFVDAITIWIEAYTMTRRKMMKLPVATTLTSSAGGVYHAEDKVTRHNACGTVSASPGLVETAKASALVTYTSPVATPRMVRSSCIYLVSYESKHPKIGGTLAGINSNYSDAATIVDPCYITQLSRPSLQRCQPPLDPLRRLRGKLRIRSRRLLQWLNVLEVSPVLGEPPSILPFTFVLPFLLENAVIVFAAFYVSAVRLSITASTLTPRRRKVNMGFQISRKTSIMSDMKQESPSTHAFNEFGQRLSHVAPPG